MIRTGAQVWASVKPRLRTPRGLVAVGGWDSGVTVVAVSEILDPATERWQSFPGPRLPRSCATVSVRSCISEALPAAGAACVPWPAESSLCPRNLSIRRRARNDSRAGD